MHSIGEGSIYPGAKVGESRVLNVSGHLTSLKRGGFQNLRDPGYILRNVNPNVRSGKAESARFGNSV